MGKIEDMRRLREQQFAETEQRRAKAAKGATVAAPAEPDRPRAAPPAPASTPAPAAKAPKTKTKTKTKTNTNTNTKAAAAPSDEAKCPSCGKVKPVKNGVMAPHQKGFGKACPGSRKAPT